jgi:hypothetical protein
MQFASLFRDSPEYERRKKTPFVPAKVLRLLIQLVDVLTALQVTLAQLHAAVPKHLYQKSTLKGLYYFARDVSCAVLTYAIATRIDPFCHYLAWNYVNPLTANFAKWTLWVIYWWWQGIILAGAWCLGRFPYLGHGDSHQVWLRTRSWSWYTFFPWMDKSCHRI